MSLTHVGKNGRVYTRKFDHDEARRRYAAGETASALAREYGVTVGAMQQVVSPKVRLSFQKRYERYRSAGRCDQCGETMSLHSRYVGSRLCRECGTKKKATTVRDGELRCGTCKKWKPDDEFPFNRAVTRHRRGRHGQCRSCQTIARREYRRRNREAENAYSREYRRRKRTPLQKATARIRDDGSLAQPSAEDGGSLTEGSRQSDS